MSAHEPTWAAAAEMLSVDATPMQAEQLLDACLLLSLAERVHIICPAPLPAAAHLLHRHLLGLRYPVYLCCDRPAAPVEASDTVVAFIGPTCTADDLSVLGSVVNARAILITIATDQAAAHLGFADAVLALPQPASATPALAGMVYDLLTLVAAEAIGRDLTFRLQRRARAMSSPFSILATAGSRCDLTPM